jgi:zinc transport system substrate-binding protein
MKKILPLILLLSTFIFANINAIVSILPVKSFVQSIGGDNVDVTLMVLPGNSPHTYEPKPSQMRAVTKAQLYFAIGVEFEKVWLPKFRDLNPAMQVIDLSEGIEKLSMAAADHHKTEHHHDTAVDPHIWTSPRNVEVIARNIYKALSKADSAHEPYYRKNLERFLQKIVQTDTRIRELLSAKPKGTKFMVFHPSWGYFAKAYGLEQIPVEVEGKNPKPRELVSIIKAAKQAHISAIFTQPEFSDASAKVIAGELHIPVIKVSPLAADWAENLIRITKAIAGVK